MFSRLFGVACLVAASSLFVPAANAAAAKGNVAAGASFEWTSESKRVLLVQPDIQLSQLDAGGVLEPRADWSQTAQQFIEQGIRDHFLRSDAEVVNSQNSTPREVQLAKLHGVVGRAILTHLYNNGAKLPNKGNALDWSLGPGTKDLQSSYGTDYALFIFVRDSYSTAARRAEQVVGAIAGAFLGVAVVPSGGVQVGFASLVDLRTGNIVWFNRLLSTTGDLRTDQPAKRTIDELIGGLPL